MAIVEPDDDLIDYAEWMLAQARLVEADARSAVLARMALKVQARHGILIRVEDLFHEQLPTMEKKDEQPSS